MSHEGAVALAFGAGVISFFSPCSVGVLPAFISYYVGRREDDAPEIGGLRREHRSFVGGLVAAFVGGALLLAALAHNRVDLNQNPLLDVSLALLGGMALSIGLALVLLGRSALPRESRLALRRAFLRGIGFGLIATVGFAIVYAGLGLAGLLLRDAAGDAGRGFASVLPWISISTALVVVGLGALLAVDQSPFTYVPPLKAPRARNAASFLLFGIAYALISMSCLLPVFLSVLAAALVLSFADAVQVFLAMAAGSGLLMVATAACVAIAKSSSVGYIRRLRPYVKPVAGALVVAFGSYTVYFDLTAFWGVERGLAAALLILGDALLLLAVFSGHIGRSARRRWAHRQDAAEK